MKNADTELETLEDLEANIQPQVDISNGNPELFVKA